MLVAEITTDHLFDRWEREGTNDDPSQSHKGKQFDYDAMHDWWGWEDGCPQSSEIPTEKTKFKLYDDDDELYYSGWLLNDDWCVVQQFVLKWAEVDSGCTTILIYKNDEAGWVQEIG